MSDEHLRPELVAWAEGLLTQTRAVLAAIETGEAALSKEEITQLRVIERELARLLAGGEVPSGER